MERTKVIDLIIKMLAEMEFDIEPGEHNMPLSDLGIDSLDFIHLTMQIESTFGITILEADQVHLSTINQIADFILIQPRYKRI